MRPKLDVERISDLRMFIETIDMDDVPAPHGDDPSLPWPEFLLEIAEWLAEEQQREMIALRAVLSQPEPAPSEPDDAIPVCERCDGLIGDDGGCDCDVVK